MGMAMEESFENGHDDEGRPVAGEVATIEQD